jgi:hypothetical protein
MPKLSINQKNRLLSAHVSFAALWTGVEISDLIRCEDLASMDQNLEGIS